MKVEINKKLCRNVNRQSRDAEIFKAERMGERGVGGRGGISTENYGSYLHRMGGGGGGGRRRENKVMKAGKQKVK